MHGEAYDAQHMWCTVSYSAWGPILRVVLFCVVSYSVSVLCDVCAHRLGSPAPLPLSSRFCLTLGVALPLLAVTLCCTWM